MVNKPDEPDKHTFIVRFWYEPGGADRGQWRGMVVQVHSQQRRFFTSFAEMNEFMFHMMQNVTNKPDEEG